jgi:hypothetical protein
VCVCVCVCVCVFPSFQCSITKGKPVHSASNYPHRVPYAVLVPMIHRVCYVKCHNLCFGAKRAVPHYNGRPACPSPETTLAVSQLIHHSSKPFDSILHPLPKYQTNEIPANMDAVHTCLATRREQSAVRLRALIEKCKNGQGDN